MKKAMAWLLIATLVLSLAGCGIGNRATLSDVSQSTGDDGGQTTDVDLQKLDALMRDYATDARMSLPDLELRGKYGFFVSWNYNEEANTKNAQVIRYELSTGEQTTIYAKEYNRQALVSVAIAVTQTDVFVAASTKQTAVTDPLETWETSEITCVSIENGEKTNLGEVPLFVEYMGSLSADRILLIGKNPDDICQMGMPLYAEIISSSQRGEIQATPESTELDADSVGYATIGSYMESNSVNTFSIDSTMLRGTGHLNLVDENGNLCPLIALDGLGEIIAIDEQAVYLINDTGTQDFGMAPVFINRVAKYTISSNTIEDVAIPTSVDGAQLYDVDNCVGDWIYLFYATATVDGYMSAGPVCRYNLKTGELVDTASAVYTDENDTAQSDPADTAQTEEAKPQPETQPETETETETALIYTAPLEKCIRSSGFYRNDRKTYHGGVDFKAAVGTEVRAVVSGKVIFAGTEKRADGTVGLGGTVVLLLGDDGYYYYYAHLSEDLLCQKGDVVVSGQVIAKSGRSTRTETGQYSADGAAAHLHLTIAIPKGADIPIPDGSGKNGTGTAEWFGGKQGIAIDPVAFLEEKGVL